ncbi:hypothetical protein L6252_00505, partial [Candidatus Parcubacteria bacterium]|nr:hypothetical protein [Candidatus Parcubacteria bacterium]
MIKKQSYRQKRHQRKNLLLKKRGFWLFVLSIILIGGLSYFLFFSPLFKIAEIPQILSPENRSSIFSIEETSNPEALTKILEGLQGKSIIFFNSKEMTKDILNLCPEFEAVYFTRNFKRKTVSLTFKLKTPSLILCQKEKENCCLADSNGSLFACKDRFGFWDKEGLPLLLCENDSLEKNYLKNIAFLKLFLETNLNLKIAFFECSPEDKEKIIAL